jgi:toxin ParE1/3/4
MIEINYHPEASAEIEAATAWYMGRSPAAAIRLVEEVDQVMAMIRQFPELQPSYDAKHRFAVLRRFPYSIVYRVDEERLRVMAFAHSSRQSGYWQGRE